MEQSPLHSAKALAPEVRRALESLLGRGLKDDETVSVRVGEGEEEGPSAEQRREALEGLQRYWGRLDERNEQAPPDEEEEIFNEAMRSVRPNYRPIR